ncbi:MAG: hypothetical protein KUG78_22015 [Kangiellaceae bacterium]|nr:hypothetical protein [Kangiellaceae bacterium]
MEIRNQSSNTLLTEVLTKQVASESTIKSNENNSLRQRSGSDDKVNVSSIAQLLSGLTATERAEMKDFRQQMMESVRSGNFDGETMAANAPQALTDFAETNGVELSHMLEKMAGRIQQLSLGGGTIGQGMSERNYGSTINRDPLSSLLDIVAKEQGEDKQLDSGANKIDV